MFLGLQADEQFFAALGKFSLTFASAERELNLMNARLASSATNLPWSSTVSTPEQNIIHALLGTQSFSAAKDTFKRLLRVIGSHDTLKPEIDIIFAQFSRIANLRNSIAHNGIEQQPDGMISTQSVPREKDRAKMMRIEASALANAIRDLEAIKTRLACMDSAYTLFSIQEGIANGSDDIFGQWHYDESQVALPTEA